MFYSNKQSGSVYKPVLLAFSVLALAACSSNDDSDGADDAVDAGEVVTTTDPTSGIDPVQSDDPDGADNTGAAGFAFVSGATPSFDAGQIERLTIGDTIEGSGSYPATLSDIVVRTDGSDIYQVGRFGIDSITRFTTNELTTPVYQYSVLQGEASPNTTDIVFASETKAYVLQAAGTEILIVNPSAATAEEFITGSIDISVYDVDAPDAVNGVVANGRLFVLMQRLTGFNPDKVGYVAVFDVETDTEIETGRGSDGLNGIELNTLNPGSLQYVAEMNEVVVSGRGNIFVEFNELPGDPYQGGVEVIDADSFALDLLVDDGTADNNQGFFSASHINSGTRGYVITSSGFANNTLRSFNPMTGLLDDAVVAGLEGLDLITLATGPAGRVWVAIGGVEPGFVLINPTDNSEVARVATEFVPNHVVFTGN